MTSLNIVIFGNAPFSLEQLRTQNAQRIEFTPVPASYPADRLDFLAPFNMVLLNSTAESEDELERIRSLRRAYGTLPIILTSKDPSPAYLVQAYRYGISDCLLAPVHEKQIIDIVGAYLKMPQQQFESHTLRFLPNAVQALWNPIRITKEADISACFLGTFRLFKKGVRIDLPGGARQRSLLAYLFFHAQDKIHRNKIIRRFWPDHDLECAKNNLNVAICNLRRFLNQHFAEEVICFQSEYFYINPALQIHRDMDAFLQAYHQGKELESHGNTRKAAQWFETASQMGTEFLEEFQQEDWTIRLREEFTEKLFHALDVLSTQQQEDEAYDAALDTLRSMLYKDDCLESVHSKIMACYLALGKNEKAVRQFHECERILSEKLKMRPSAETEALLQAARGVCRA